MRVFLIVFMLFLLAFISACAKPSAAPAEPLQIAQSSPPKSITPPPPPASMNGVTRAAFNAGVRTCLERIDQVSKYITAKTQSKFIMSMPPADVDVDRQITSATFEVKLPNEVVAYASMTAAPTTDGGCDALYETVVYWANSCAVVAEQGFPNAKQIGVIQQHIKVLLQENANFRVFLLPAGNEGCVAIKKEVVY